MTSTIKVNNIQNQCGANIINENSNTITIGASGDTVTLASGASQTGFGRTGTVDWDTTAKTASFTAVSGNGYFVNTTSGAITVTLPASPDAGAVIAVKDYANTFDTNNVTLARNGSNIGGEAIDATLLVEGLAVTLVYVDATKGWLVTDSGLQDDAPQPTFITATGGTITEDGDFKVHTFTGPGTFCVSAVGNPVGSNTIQTLLVAGGGGGGDDYGGGGGAGGYIDKTPSPTPVTAQGYPIAVGGGGAGGTGGAKGANGVNSTGFSLTTIGGGGGGGGSGGENNPGTPGGSGGGARGNRTPTCIQGSGTQPSQPGDSGTFGFGNDGGTGATPSAFSGSGGGAGAAGTPASGSPTGAVGKTSDITGSSVSYAGGGGGTEGAASPCGTGGAGSPGGGGGSNGTTNRGGGGGGDKDTPGNGGNGGSGVVIIRYKFQ